MVAVCKQCSKLESVFVSAFLNNELAAHALEAQNYLLPDSDYSA
jgi:hypothetical protein